MDKHQLVKMSKTVFLPWGMSGSLLRDLASLKSLCSSSSSMFKNLMFVKNLICHYTHLFPIIKDLMLAVCRYEIAHKSYTRTDERYNPAAADLYGKTVFLKDSVEVTAKELRVLLADLDMTITEEYVAELMLIEQIIQLILKQSAACLHEVDQITPNRLSARIMYCPPSPKKQRKVSVSRASPQGARVLA